MLPETLHDVPAPIESAAQEMFAAQLARHTKKFGGGICYVSDLAKQGFFDWVRRHHAHPLFAERFTEEATFMARYILLTTHRDFCQAVGSLKMPRRRRVA